MVVELYCQESDFVITRTYVPSGHPVCLTGVIDLPEGEWTLCVRLRPQESDAISTGYGNVRMQAIVGQTVNELGNCSGGGSTCA
jgi:hypothetical protein